MNDWLIWQLADSAFPTGGFAHSGGLEAAWRHGYVCNGPALHDYLQSSIVQLQRGVLRFLLDAWENPDELSNLDEACDLFLNNHVANRASRAQGKAFVKAAATTFEVPPLIELASQARVGVSAMHLAPVVGLVCKHLGLPKDQSASMFLFISARSTLSSAVRLGIVGPMEAQRIQASLPQQIAELNTAEFEAVQTAPLQDLLQGTHDRLYSRLFQT